jgi:hypothetical protein
VTERARKPSGGSPLRVVVTLLFVIALGAVLAWWLRPMERAARKPPAEAQPAAPSAAPTSAKPAPQRPARREPRRTAEPAPPRASGGASAAPAGGPRLKVTSDVEGASVFVDRQFLGKTPLETGEVTPGHHQLNVSSEGYEGVSQGVEIAATGSTDVNVSLKTVRLNASVAVVHKHTIGSCEGQLKADTHGLRYETSNRDDAFVLPFADVEEFTLDYKQKNLRIKKRHGRTWNFTTHAANADSLLVFQRDVDRARARLTQ